MVNSSGADLGGVGADPWGEDKGASTKKGEKIDEGKGAHL